MAKSTISRHIMDTHGPRTSPRLAKRNIEDEASTPASSLSSSSDEGDDDDDDEESPSSPSSSSSEGPSSKKRKHAKMEENSQPTKSKPFKVCDARRSLRVGVVAKTLEELRDRIQKRIPGLNEEFKVVLEDDCTWIENEKYFQTLPNNSVVIAVNKDQEITNVTSSGPRTRSEGYVEVDGNMSDDPERHLANVAHRIARNPALLAYLPQADLEVVIDADICELQVKLSQSKDDAKFIQEACERRLNDQIKSDDASALLKLYHRAKTESVQAEATKNLQA